MKYEVFVSYSRVDSEIVNKIVKALAQHNISVWIDKDGVESGDAFKSVIVNAIKNSPIFLFFSSRNSNNSPWTVKEVNTAVYLKKFILPVKLDDAAYDDSILFDLGGLSFIDYYKNPETGMTELIKSVKSHIEESTIDIKKIKEEIATLEKDGIRLYTEQKRILDLINAKRKKIGENERKCPVCGSMHDIILQYCPTCGWTYIPFQSAKLDEKRLKAFRALQKTKPNDVSPEKSEDHVTDLPLPIQELIHDMVKVEGGTFIMGGTEEQGEDAFSDEMPAHKVTLSSFYIGKYPVRQEQWEAVMGKNPAYFKGPKLPVESVNWSDCQEFVAQLSRITGRHFRLPTEAEWEYAARGGNRSGHYKYSGSNNLDEVGWYNENSESMTHLPGEKIPNELGLFDMSGNVWEWVQDWKADFSELDQINPTGPQEGEERICRGGGWNREPDRARVSYRGDDLPDLRYCSLGLRIVMEE